MRDVRIIFKKQGLARYTSHLDMNRFMSRVIRRALIPVWYTEGFNPHPYITFAQPLSLGFCSDCEIMDMRVVEEISNEEIRGRLSGCMPDGIEIVRVVDPVLKPKEIAFAGYELVISLENNETDLKETFGRYLTQSEIIVNKKSKKGVKEFDLKPHIKGIAVSVQQNGSVKIGVTLPSSNTLSVNPVLLVDSLAAFADFKIKGLEIKKTALFTAEKELFC